MDRFGRGALGVVPAIALLGAAGCASTNPPKLATCDGKHLRDVNIYGTVLPGGEQPGSPAAADEAPPPPPATGAWRDTEEKARLASLRPCGGQG
ncbi:hypothetical protein [Tardibacter chloracetimidivorans]|nr:hypothetical protein [Tardibacter chloracetimidivorans]MBB4151212.1 hypothetical protein [Sphingobium scionense]